MAKVKSINSSSSLYTNNTSFPDLKFGLEITKDCSSKCDFDISLFLTDNEACSEEQFIDKSNWNGKKSDNANGRCSPISLKAESSKFVSLGTLAEDHLKKDKMLPEKNFNGDFNLSDLLSNDYNPVCSAVNNSIKMPSSESDNLFDLSFLIEDNNSTVRKAPDPKNGVSCDDLSNWMNSVSQISVSLQFHSDNFASNDIKEKLKNSSFISPHIETKDICTGIQLSECLENIQGSSKSLISNIELERILTDVSTNNSNTVDSSETNSRSQESANETSDDDFLPDIDLTFCIKKNSKNDFSLYGNSPETIDSGFDETDFTSDKSTSLSDGNFFYKDILIPQNSTYSKSLTSCKVKQSLFSRAISAKSKIDDAKKSKLKKIENELLKGSIPLLYSTQHLNSKNSQKIIDHSNEHVITSSYLKFIDEK